LNSAKQTIQERSEAEIAALQSELASLKDRVASLNSNLSQEQEKNSKVVQDVQDLIGELESKSI